MGKSDNTLARDMVLLCENAVGHEAAQNGIRALCRYFGGQMVYVPAKKDTGDSAKKLLGVLRDAVNEKAALGILDKLMFRFGGIQMYFPIERRAFRKTIAREIYERNYQKGESINDLAREYGMSFTNAYRHWYLGRDEKLSQPLPFDC